MKLKMLQLELRWPNDIPVQNLRSWIVSQLEKEGEPLRWAITRVDSLPSVGSCRQLKVEAVVISP